MADENVINEDLDSRNKEKKEKKHDSGAADLERVTNYAEEKEIKSDADILSVINNVKRQEYADKLQRDQELSKVAIKKQDVELIMRELEVTKQVAERSLREHKGNLSATLVMLTD
ncbi:hypothetical protein HAZT_HAZT000283 [Hyalella azteca]|uniref:Huntingtin-interacting protein K n=1 Tax=Hyalella azteca TaxID=294128 RepID=A0A6A0HA28_HYAAZ|nr:huntingtin-interacting protein K [Hyalella azteca]KAA0201845.1 hypothetical protein HAZT_HAZT000283 [Hyalella azteca]